ncbi:hypothetical protein AnigIFM63604_004241, partial [Aspergillus niger]
SLLPGSRILSAVFWACGSGGRTTGALNLGENNFKDVGQVKRSEGYDRASKLTLPAPRDLFNSRANRDASYQIIGGQM